MTCGTDPPRLTGCARKEARHHVPYSTEAKSEIPGWGKVDSGIGLPMVNVLESTQEWTYGCL